VFFSPLQQKVKEGFSKSVVFVLNYLEQNEHVFAASRGTQGGARQGGCSHSHRDVSTTQQHTSNTQATHSCTHIHAHTTNNNNTKKGIDKE